LDGDTALQIGLRCQALQADTIHDILADGVLTHNGYATQAIPAQGSFMISLCAAEDLYLEGFHSDLNAYVCLQFKSRADALPQTAFSSCSIRNSSPDWNEVFRFDTETLDPTAYLVAWVLAAPGADETEILQATNLAMTSDQITRLQQAGVDIERFGRPDFSDGLDHTLKRLKRRVDREESRNVTRLQKLEAAKESGQEPTDDLKRKPGPDSGTTLSERRWIQARNFLAVLKKTGCDAPLPLADSTHIPVGCIIVRFRQLRAAVWGTEPVEINRALRLSCRGFCRLEVDFRPKLFCPIDPAPPQPGPQDEEGQLFNNWDNLTPDVLQKLFPEDFLSSLAQKPSKNTVHEQRPLASTPAHHDSYATLKRFFQIAILTGSAIRRQQEMGTGRSKKGMEGAQRAAIIGRAVESGVNAIKNKIQKTREERALRKKSLDSKIEVPEKKAAISLNEEDEATSGLLDEPWLEELVDGSRFV
jgi:hypothetical protein